MLTRRQLAAARLVAQGLIAPHATALDAVTAHVAMQGQDLPGVIASTALRTPRPDPVEVLAELDAGRIVRSYPMRGTVFLMPSRDAVWVTQLCSAPSLRAAEARRRQLGLDEGALARAEETALEALADGPRSRPELFGVWEAAGLAPKGGRGYHMLFTLIARSTVCHGPWNGTDQDIALVSSWLAAGSDLAGRFDGERIPAVAELLLRYLSSHGPATIRDFAWWTKLGLAEIRAALPLVAGHLESDGAAEPSYWRAGLLDEVAALGRAVSRPLLLPGFDEFILGYQDRLFAMTRDQHDRLVPGHNGVFKKTVVQGAQVVGIWSRGGRPGRRSLEIEAFRPISAAGERALQRRFEEFPFVGQ